MFGYVIIGFVVGCLSFLGAMLAGASVWVGLGLYVVASTFGILAVPVMQAAAGVVKRTNAGETALDPVFGFADEGRSSTAAEPGARSKESMSILAVDDDAFILELLPKITARAGFADVVGVASAAEALELLARPDTAFDCLLLDVSMPGMDGIELCRRVRAMPAYRNAPIIMLTAMRDVKNIGDAILAGATDYTTKPFDIEDLGIRLADAYATVRERRAGTAGISDASHLQIPDAPFDVRRLDNLVSSANLSMYLGLLPTGETPKVSVLAVAAEAIEADAGIALLPPNERQLMEVAAVTAECLARQRPLVAIVDGDVVMVAADSADLPQVEALEKHIGAGLAARGIPFAVTIGGPVRPVGAKSGRAEVAFTRAVGLAAERGRVKRGNEQSRVVRLIR